ncbi:MAG TPA: DNA double-strand break repair nuclease NurA [Dehalococcoidia bacterium]|nr:DNA double-strand break repair nuclease NurA [Dehalococcoidia bacterium]
MSLDLTNVIGQIWDLAAAVRSRETERKTRLDFAVETLKSVATDFDGLRRRVETGKTTWLVAALKERADLCQPAPPCPEDFIVLASDGSHIDIDRHQSAHCFLINIGVVRLQYGKNADAQLSSFPFLYFEDEETTIDSPDGQRTPIEGQLLGVKRSVEECRVLAERAHQLTGDMPVVALLDGSLILWGLTGQAYSDFVIRELLIGGFLKHLNRLRELVPRRRLAVASYISFPRSTDVVNLLRLAICPYEPVDCDRNCPGKFEGRECDRVGNLLDRDLFGRVLAVGERSAIFGSRSSVVLKYYGAQEVNFFYIRLDGEIARVEVPQWVAQDGELVGLVHSVVLDQCQRGLGYPVALSEAHEQAVVTGADREQFWILVEQVLAEGGVYLESSAKRQSKRIRWL